MVTLPHRLPFLRMVGRILFNVVLLVTLLSLTLWAVGALFFMLPFEGVRGLAAASYAFVILVLLIAIRPFWKGVVTGLGLFLLVLVWSFTIQPSNEGRWQPDVAETAWAKIDGDKVTIHNFSQFRLPKLDRFHPELGNEDSRPEPTHRGGPLHQLLGFRMDSPSPCQFSVRGQRSCDFFHRTSVANRSETVHPSGSI
jgi:hypothetical protein